MKIFVTGATGFVGQAVTKAALEQGHQVRAVIRPSSEPKSLAQYLDNKNFEVAKVDLRDRKTLVTTLEGVDLVIHLAATKAGDFYTQFAGTVMATENLLIAMSEARVTNLVGVSTFSVYDYVNLKPKSLLDEESATVTDTKSRDEYTQTKLIQENLYRTFGQVKNNRITILRPGMIFGAGELWHALLGSPLGPVFLRVGSTSTLPLTYVDNCADAIVAAAEKLPEAEELNGQVINIVDDDLPSQQQYAKMVEAEISTPRTVKIPWAMMRGIAGSFKVANQKLVSGRAKFPGIVATDKLHARFKPLRYSNQKAKKMLGWYPQVSIPRAIRQSAEQERLLEQSEATHNAEGSPNL